MANLTGSLTNYIQSNAKCKISPISYLFVEVCRRQDSFFYLLNSKLNSVVCLFFFLAGMINLKSSKTNKNKFERNKVDEFVVEAVDIGELKKIK